MGNAAFSLRHHGFCVLHGVCRPGAARKLRRVADAAHISHIRGLIMGRIIRHVGQDKIINHILHVGGKCGFHGFPVRVAVAFWQ